MVNTRIAQRFADLRQEGKKALIPYITAGDPHLERTFDLVLALEKAGADIVELGIPYSDPLADGPVIQRAAQRALQAGTKVRAVLSCVRRLREVTEIPLVFLVYYNSVLRFGVQPFLAECVACGVDGLIIPDLPLEERASLLEMVVDQGYPVDLIPLVAPTSKERVGAITRAGSGFVYCVSSSGVTGERHEFAATLGGFLQEVQDATELPTAIGFGIGSTEAVVALRDLADGLIVGSAIVRVIEQAELAQDDTAHRVQQFVGTLRQALG